MKNNLKQHHVTCVRLKCQDFLTTDPKDYKKVEYILLDPSCSGSGMVNRYKYGIVENETQKDEQRLWYLEALQRKMLMHAMSFPNVKRIVYSTCSIHEEENESVVLYGLKHCRNKFKLEHIHPTWPNRGHKNIKTNQSKREFNLEYCVRTDINDNLTNGFFIACFVLNEKKTEIEDENENNVDEQQILENEEISNDDLKKIEIKPKKRKLNEIE